MTSRENAKQLPSRRNRLEAARRLTTSSLSHRDDSIADKDDATIRVRMEPVPAACEQTGGRARLRHVFLVLVLQPVEAVVEAALGDKFLMRADLPDFAVVHDHDAIGVPR